MNFQFLGLPQDVQVELVTEEMSFSNMHNAWNELAAKVGNSNVFLRHEWFDAVWQWKQNESSLYIVCVYKGSVLIGILPLTKTKSRKNYITLSKLTYLDIPDTQFCDLICEAENSQMVLVIIVRYLSKCRKDWDILEVQKLSRQSLLFKIASKAVSTIGLAFELVESGYNPGIGLDDMWEEFYGRRSRRLKKGNNHVANKLKREGKAIRVEWLNDDLNDIDKLYKTLDVIRSLSSNSWKADTGLTLDNPGPNAFLTRITEHAAKNQWLSIFILYLADEPVAAEYQLKFNGVISALRADYDKKYEGPVTLAYALKKSKNSHYIKLSI